MIASIARFGQGLRLPFLGVILCRGRLQFGRTIGIAAFGEVMNHRFPKREVRVFLGQLQLVARDVDHFEPAEDGFEGPGEKLAGSLNVVQSARVDHEHPAVGQSFEDVGDPSPHGHGATLGIEPGPAFHPAFGQDEHKGLAVNLFEYFIPCGVTLPGHCDGVPDEGPEKETDSAVHGLFCDREDAFTCKRPQQLGRGVSCDQRLVKAGVVQDRDDTGVISHFDGFGRHPIFPEPEQEPAGGSNTEQQQKNEN